MFVSDDVAASNAFYDQTWARHHTEGQGVTHGLRWPARTLHGASLQKDEIRRSTVRSDVGSFRRSSVHP